MIHGIINTILRKLGKEGATTIDPRVDGAYLFLFLMKKAISAIRGVLLFRERKLIFVGRRTTILSKKNITAGHNLMIGDDCHIDAISHEGIRFGNNVSIQKRCIIECTGSLRDLGQGLVLGDSVGIGSGSFLGCAGGISIGADTIIGNFVSLHSENHNFSEPDVPIRLQGVNRQGISIGENCWIGAKVTILDGANIQNGCVVAAGALVLKGEYEADSIYAGVPAKLIKKRCDVIEDDM